MKVEVLTETTLKKSKKAELTKSEAKSLTLDQIEEKMVEYATSDGDLLTMMINEKKLSMLEKVANLKIHRLQLKELEKQNVITDVKPIEVKFIKSNTTEQEARIERIDNEILNKQTGNNNA